MDWYPVLLAIILQFDALGQ